MGVEYQRNPWTLSSRKGYIEHTTVREDAEGTVINCEGIDITLDPSVSAKDIKEVDENTTNAAVADVFVHRREVQGRQYIYYFVDVESKQKVLISPAQTALPEASFNGLVWWTLRGHICPTFIDLNTPGVVYHNPERAIGGVNCTNGHIQGSKSRGLCQFLFGRIYNTADLVSGVVTTLQGRQEDPSTMHVLPGFVDGVFQARTLGYDTTNAIEVKVLSTE
ncbi:hypothetical protein CJU89_6704 [Yarrowia sp. B02]|nr:hypothetical protein CJU89_6704 [Yarrowia sp. B02]